MRSKDKSNCWQALLTEYQHWSTFWQSTQKRERPGGKEGEGTEVGEVWGRRKTVGEHGRCVFFFFC